MRRLLTSLSWLAVLAAVLVSAPAGHAQAPARIAPSVYGNLHWRFIGPEGNRFSAAVGVPGDPTTYYVGAASGGIYKTTDGGVNWASIFDDQPVQSIGSLAIDPSDSNIVWAGTGEPHIRSHISVGQGIYKSMDAGKTWQLMGLEQTGRIARVLVHPKDGNVVLACALGHAYGPQQERGVYRSTDGGATWTRTLFADENTGCSELAMDPSNPRILFAGMWTLEIRTWGRTSGGPGGGLYTSRDGGVTWKKITGNGLPTKNVGKVAVAIARSNPQRVYAMIETGDGIPLDGSPTEAGQVWRSDDGGATWRVTTYDRNAMGRAHYYSHFAVAPDDEDELYFLTASYAKSIDGAQTLVTLPRAQSPGGDHHDIWIDPGNANRQIVAHDQGLSITINRGKTWFRQRLTNAQIYHVTVDNEIPYNVLGNKQDEPSYRGPSNSRLGGGFGGDPGIPRAMWHSVGGGESGWATPDPTNSKLVWSTASGSGMVGGIVVRFDENRRQLRNVEVWPYQQNGPPADLKYRFVWDAPLHISPHDNNTIYVGSQHVHRTTNGGQSWEEISPDLTLNDKTKQGSSGGLTPDNIGVEYSGVVYAIAESPREKGLIWVGTNDGLVQLTRDAGKSWTNVTKNIPNLPVWGSVRSIVPSKYDAGTAYLSVDFHQMNNRDPFIYKTTDYGKTFTAITNGIQKSMLSYVKVLCEDPVRRGLLYAGTENGIYASFDDGANWQPLQIDLPHAPVSGIVVQTHFNDLVISTYGRGFFILDDITPLQQMTPQVLAADAHLFAPRPAYRFRPITAPSTTYDDPTVGENPKYGAYINYYLKSAPTGPAKIDILDARNQVVRTLPATTRAGLNRVTWDLMGEPGAEVRLRTSPLYAPQPQFRPGPDGTRPAPGTGRITVLMPPGAYTVKLTVGGKDYTAPLTVRKDPNSEGTEADIQAQTQLLTTLRGHASTAGAMVDQMELIRSQLEALDKLNPDAATKTAVNELTQQLIDTEMNLVDLRQTGTGQDGVRFGAKLLSRINYLANGLTGSDFKPTDQHVAAEKVIADELKKVQALVDTLRNRVMGGFNEQLKGKNLPPIVLPSRQ